VHLVAPDHLGERLAELGRAHRAGERHQHAAAARQLRLIALRGVDQRGRIEVLEVCVDELADGH
jgi:hypothetical protein